MHTATHDSIFNRLPQGVEATFVKMIVSRALGPFPVSLVKGATSLGDLFQQSYGRILAGLSERRQHVLKGLDFLGDEYAHEALKRLGVFDGLEHLIFSALIEEPEIARQGRTFHILHPLIGHGEHTKIQVWTLPRKSERKARFLAEADLRSGDEYIRDFNRTVEKLLRKHCRWNDLMRLRFRGQWWTRRKPPGWPAVTEWLIPKLYDYLQPYYPTRPYTKGRRGQKAGPGAYSRRLMEDMAAILRAERPDLCEDLSPRRVIAAVQSYLRIADPKRPLGKEMFIVVKSRRQRKL